MNSKTLNRVADFEKVSKDIFEAACYDLLDKEKYELSSEILKDMYDSIHFPKRATKGSAGYDFFTPLDFMLEPGESISIPTGIRVNMRADYVLMIFPRSGLGFKYRLQLNNTVGIIDSDYYNAKNEGHIIIKLTNDSKEQKQISLEKGKGFAQGIFLQYGITNDDDVCDERDGGFGSTDKK